MPLNKETKPSTSIFLSADIVLIGFVWFYGTSTIVGNSIPNHLYTYILKIYDLFTHFIEKFLNELLLILLLSVKYFQVLLCNTNNSIKLQSFVDAQ